MNWKHSLQITALALCATAASASATSLKSYHIGNSLTNDAVSFGDLERIASAAGNSLDTARHLRCANPLTNIVADPDDFCITQPLGSWEEALANNSFDVLTLQPHTGASLGQEADSFNVLLAAARVNSSNIDTYLYQAYPAAREAANYQSFWDATSSLSDADNFQFTRNHLDYVYEEIDGPSIDLIPVGEVLYEFDIQARAGQIEGYSSAADLYRDSRHLNSAGSYLAALTFHTVIFDQSPIGLSQDSFRFNSEGLNLDLAVQGQLQQIVLSAVAEESRTGVTFVPEPSSAAILLISNCLLGRSRKLRANRVL